MTAPVKEPKTKTASENLLKRLTRHQLFIPLAALALLVLFNLIADPSFFAVTVKENSLGNPVLSGNIISVLDNASELVILAIGMTLVTASSGGQDISVGAAMAIAGFIRVSRSGSINYSRIAENIEMDAILAVALGGNALSGGKFNIYGSILGAYVIQFLTTTLYKYEVPSTALPAYKAVVVILLVVLSAPVVQEKLASIKKAPAKTAKEVS